MLARKQCNWHHGGLPGEPSGRIQENGMAEISIVQEHSMTAPMARAAAQQVADKFAAEYGVACRWEGDNVLRFERSGVEGALTLGEQRAALHIKLGFLMGPFAGAIESKAVDKMRRVFAA
jgi:putative polyhydroxyalkanoate system protein